MKNLKATRTCKKQEMSSPSILNLAHGGALTGGCPISLKRDSQSQMVISEGASEFDEF
jgi:hypothetical protein